MKNLWNLRWRESRRSFIALTGLAAAAFALTGCPSSDQSAGGGTTGGASPVASAGASGKKIKLAFVTNNSSDFWTIAQKGTEKAKAENPNIDVDFVINSEGSAASQKAKVDDLLAKGVDGVAISPKDPANQTDMLNNIAKQAALVTQDSDAPNSNRLCYIGTDNVAAGRQAGEEIKKSLPGGGKIMLFVGSKDAQNAKERAQGITEALKGSNVTIIDTRTDEADHAKAKANAADTLVAHPDVAALVGLWSYNGPAILSAVKEANKVGKVKIICFDEEDDTLAGVKSGAIDATIVQQPFEFGYQTMTKLAKYLGGDKSVFPPDKKIIVETKVIKKADVDAFQTKLNELRGRTPAAGGATAASPAASPASSPAATK